MSARPGSKGYPAVPPGWSENPTAWPKRIRLLVIALVGFLVAGYLTLYQLDVFSGVWDPFFPYGSPKVLSLTEPLPDVALVLIQPLVVGAWCTLCLTSAAVSFTIFALGYKEPLAGLQHMRKSHASGQPLWHTLWGLDGASEKASQ